MTELTSPTPEISQAAETINRELDMSRKDGIPMREAIRQFGFDPEALKNPTIPNRLM